MIGKRHPLITPFVVLETKVWLSALNTIEKIAAAFPFNEANGFSDSASHIFIVPSALPEAKRSLCAMNAISVTALSWPVTS